MSDLVRCLSPVRPFRTRCIKNVMLLLALSFAVGSIALAQQMALPVKVSANGRYFVDQNGGDGTKPNVYGQKAWIADDPLTPNEAYFRNVDTVIRMARDNGLVILPSVYHQSYRKYITVSNARRWAKWLAQRYKDTPNIVWAMTPEAKQEFVPVIRELAAGLREGDGGRHLISLKPDPSPYSSSFLTCRELAGFQLHADLERRQADLSHGDPRLHSQACQAGSHGRRRV